MMMVTMVTMVTIEVADVVGRNKQNKFCGAGDGQLCSVDDCVACFADRLKL
jgi:hypothetical protein